MFRPNFIYELKQLLRSKWLLLLSVILVLLFGFATYNGLNKVEDRKTIIALAQTETQGNDTKMLKILDSLEQGQQVSLSPWELPSDPVVVGSN
jgi:ABC-2 type transport system permease protein